VSPKLDIEPFTSSDDLFQLAGGALNAAVTLPACLALVSVAGSGSGLLLAAGLAAGTFAADLVSGVLHWAFDTYFSDRNTLIKRTVLIVREHHVFPERIFRYGLWREAGTVSWFAAIGAAPVHAIAWAAPAIPSGLRFALIVAALTFALELTFMLQFHKAGHRPRRGRTIRALQRMRLLLAPEHHLTHHAGRHDVNYCLINGIADDTLGRVGFFRFLEVAIQAATGAIAREHDRELLAWYGRPVDDAPPARRASAVASSL
jgi:ubiquitin-conjugating enzyme E2 variant